jgi:hypothetical protein
MLSKTLFTLASASMLLGTAAALTPVAANYDPCVERPYAKSCPGNFDVTHEEFYVAPSKQAHQVPRSNHYCG